LKKIIELDTKSAIQAFKANEFSIMNAFANRAMANAIMGKDKKLVLPGFFLKDIAMNYGIILVQPDSAISTAKTVGNSYMESLLGFMAKIDDVKLEDLWKSFFKFSLEIKEFLKDTFEKDNYSSDEPKFGNEAFLWLLNYLDESKEILVEPRNRLLEGTINEMDRIFKTHGSLENGFYCLSMMRALQRYHSYFGVAHKKEDKIDPSEVKKIYPYIERIKKFLSNEKVDIDEVMNVVWELTSNWRLLFIRYMEIQPSIAIERAIQLPEEVKSKLTKSVTQAMEKEVKKDMRSTEKDAKEE
jgi:hypothetical protein